MKLICGFLLYLCFVRGATGIWYSDGDDTATTRQPTQATPVPSGELDALFLFFDQSFLM